MKYFNPYIFTITFLITFSFSALGLDKQSASEMLKLHEQSFTKKQLMNNKDLCQFHNSLLNDAMRDKSEQLDCGRNLAPQTNDEELSVQLQNLNNLNKVSQAVHPDINESSILDEALMRIKHYAQSIGNIK